MKLSHKTFALFMICSFSTQLWAEGQKNSNTQVKVEVSKEDPKELLKLSKEIDDKQSKVIVLINVVGSIANERFSVASEMDKENVESAYNGFIARLQNIREDREALERKEIAADRKMLEDYSLRLNQLMADLHSFLYKN